MTATKAPEEEVSSGRKLSPSPSTSAGGGRDARAGGGDREEGKEEGSEGGAVVVKPGGGREEEEGGGGGDGRCVGRGDPPSEEDDAGGTEEEGAGGAVGGGGGGSSDFPPTPAVTGRPSNEDDKTTDGGASSSSRDETSRPTSIIRPELDVFRDEEESPPSRAELDAPLSRPDPDPNPNPPRPPRHSSSRQRRRVHQVRPGAVRVAGPGAAPPAPALARSTHDVSDIRADAVAARARAEREADGEDNHEDDAMTPTIEGYTVPVSTTGAGAGGGGSSPSPPPLVVEGVAAPEPTSESRRSSSRKKEEKVIKNRRKALFAGGALALLVVVAAVAAGAVVGTRRASSSTSTSTTVTTTTTTTTTTAMAMAKEADDADDEPARSDRYSRLRSAILSSVGDDARRRSRLAASLRDDASPQGRALLWLADEDDLRVDVDVVDPSSSEADDGSAGRNKRAVQRFALAAVYYSTGGEGWVNRAGFLTNVSECEWNEVEEDPTGYEGLNFVGTKCDDNSTVTHLQLGNNYLVGSLPEELTMLTKLTDLSVFANFLEGEIPGGLPQSIEVLSVDTNKFNGTLPVDIWSMSGLKELWAHDNRFEGTLSTEIGKLAHLEGFTISTNEFVGSIPTQLGNLEALWIIDLSASGLRGTIPTELGGLTSLQSLYLDKNCFVGSVPGEVCALMEEDGVGALEEIVVRSPTKPLPCNELECGCCDRQQCGADEPCAESWFCNYDFGESGGFCEPCGDVNYAGYCDIMLKNPAGVQDCRARCFPA